MMISRVLLPIKEIKNTGVFYKFDKENVEKAEEYLDKLEGAIKLEEEGDDIVEIFEEEASYFKGRKVQSGNYNINQSIYRDKKINLIQILGYSPETYSNKLNQTIQNCKFLPQKNNKSLFDMISLF